MKICWKINISDYNWELNLHAPFHIRAMSKIFAKYLPLRGSRQIGPLADLPANFAPHFLGPNLPFSGKLGPGKLDYPARLWHIGNSLVYGIYVFEISAYMLKYQHCWKISKVVMKFQHTGTVQKPHQPPRELSFDILILEYQNQILKLIFLCQIRHRLSPNYITKWKYIKVSRDLESWIFSE